MISIKSLGSFAAAILIATASSGAFANDDPLETIVLASAPASTAAPILPAFTVPATGSLATSTIALQLSTISVNQQAEFTQSLMAKTIEAISAKSETLTPDFALPGDEQ